MMGGKKPPSSASTTGYSARKIAETERTQTIGVATIQAVRDVLVEMLSACKANPIIGVITAVVVVDMLHRAGLITAGAYSACVTFISVAFGVTVAIEVAETGVALITGITGGGSTAPDPGELIKPVPTTLVEAANPASPTPAGSAGGILSKIPVGALMG
jgi:hypothetical protein